MEARQDPKMGNRLPLRQPSNGSHRLLGEEAQSAAEMFITEHHETKRALEAASASNESLKMQLRDLFRENEELRERLASAETRAAFLNAYAVEITTCVDNLKSTTEAIIENAIERGRKNGVRAVQDLGTDEARQEEHDEREEAARVIGNLPINDWKSS